MKKSHFKITLLFLIVLTFTYHVVGSPPDSSNMSLDSLRISIQTLQDSLQYLTTVKDKEMQEFKQINEQIYKYKEEPNQPLIQFRLQNALKASREIADRIATIDRKSQDIKSQLQNLFQEIIKTIDAEIQGRITNSKPGSPNRDDMSIIQNLGKEKLRYLDQLQSIVINEDEWQQLEIEPDDTPQRIRMKFTILNDKLEKIERSISQEEVKLEELIKDSKVHKEMIGFYIELSRAVEDEQEIFDRNRLDELRDHLETLTIKITDMEHKIIAMKVDVVNIKKKIEQFTQASSTFNERLRNR